MRRVVWSQDAIDNVEAIVTYVSQFNPDAAARLAARLRMVADSLGEFSNRGRMVGGDLRELTSIWPYIMRHQVESDRVVVLRIRHGAQQDDDPT